MEGAWVKRELFMYNFFQLVLQRVLAANSDGVEGSLSPWSTWEVSHLVMSSGTSGDLGNHWKCHE